MNICTICCKAIDTGYGINRNNEKVCYACLDRDYMAQHDRMALYLQGSNGQYQVINWPGTLRIPIISYSHGRHNIAGSRVDVWFKDHTGRRWWGVQYGEWTQIVHCRKLKEKEVK